MAYRMKMLRSHYETLRKHLTSEGNEERACFVLCAIATSSSGKILLAREVIPLEPADLLVQGPDQLSVKPDAMLRIARKAANCRLSLCMVHTHPMQVGRVDFSFADDIGNARSFRFFNRMLPDAINSALIWDCNISAVTGRVYETADQWVELERVEIAGEPYALTTILKHQTSNHPPEFLQYDRHLPLIGKKGVEMLGHLSFAVIGNGGIGSVASILMSHSGAGRLMLVDHDRVDKTSCPRVIAATPEDIRALVHKVIITQRYINQINPHCAVMPYPLKVQNPDLLRELVGVDVIICTTDDHTSRAFLNQICQQYYIPILDLGVQFVVSPDDGKIVNEIGKINLVLPGTACLLCTNHVDPERVRYENLPDDQKERLVAEGYIRGVVESQPSMMMFNMEVVARGVQILAAHILGIKSANIDTFERFAFFGARGATHHKLVAKRQREDCIFCGKASFCLGAGDSIPMLIQDDSVASTEKEMEHA